MEDWFIRYFMIEKWLETTCIQLDRWLEANFCDWGGLYSHWPKWPITPISLGVRSVFPPHSENPLNDQQGFSKIKGCLQWENPLVVCYIAMEAMAHRNRWFTYYKWWFSMDMLVITRWYIFRVMNQHQTSYQPGALSNKILARNLAFYHPNQVAEFSDTWNIGNVASRSMERSHFGGPARRLLFGVAATVLWFPSSEIGIFQNLWHIPNLCGSWGKLKTMSLPFELVEYGILNSNWL